MKFGRAILSALLLLLGSFAHLCAAPTALPRYNVLLIMADDLRCAVNAYGDKQAKTPNIDRLAGRGVRFDRAYVQYSVCNPSRVSMLTSTRPEKNGVTGNNIFFREKMPNVVTLPQLFRQHGARSISYGKIYHAGLVEGDVENRMLDLGRSWDDARMFGPTPLGAQGNVRNLTAGKLKWCSVGAMEGSDDDQADGQTAAHAIAGMEKHADVRWFLGAGFHRPHDPFLVSKKYVALYPPGSLTIHKDSTNATPKPPLAISGGAFQNAFDAFTDEDRLAFLTHYYAGISQTDAQVGRLMTALDRLKLWDNTIVIFLGDHGYHLGERNWWNKHTLFERACRFPFIIVAPGMKPAVTQSLVELTDLYPTVTELCGLKSPPHVEGRSLVPILQNPSAAVRDAAVTYVTRGRNSGTSIRTDKWRYTLWTDGAAELYDHDSDPEEWQNLAARPEHAQTVAQLRRRLQP